MTDIDEARMISFLGVRTDRHGFGILTWKHVGTQKNFQLKESCVPTHVFGDVDVVQLPRVHIDGVEALVGPVHHFEARPFLHRQVHQHGLLVELSETLTNHIYCYLIS